MPRINDSIEIPDAEIKISAIRSRGPGGQNVNKVASAVQLRFDLLASTALPEDVKLRLMQMRDRRITAGGIVLIKAQRSRSQEKNRLDALRRFRSLIEKALLVQKPRKKTRPSKKAREKRLSDKLHRSRVKKSRGSIED